MLETEEAASGFTPSEARIAPSGDPRIDSLRYAQGWVWGTNTITYSFFAGGAYYGSESNPQPVSIAVQNNVRYIFSEILQPLIGLTFVEVTDAPTSYGLMRFLASTSASYAYAYAPTAGDVNTGGGIDVVGDVVLNPGNDVVGSDFNSRNNSFQSGPGSHGFTTLIHEIGHAIGLKHPFDGSPTLPTSQNNQDNTVMTYTFQGKAPAMPMPYDVLALQYFYGENQTTRADDTTYVFTAVDAFTPGSGSADAPSAVFGRTKQLLWDPGGQDTVDFSQLPSEASGYRFDVRPGGWITTTSAYNSIVYSGTNFVTDFGTRIALSGTSIENVIVSLSDDTIFLNDASNRVSGYTPGIPGGNDVIHGSDGSDTLDLSTFARASVSEVQVGDSLRIDLGVTGTITVVDYFLATPDARMRLLYEPDAEIMITADRVSLIAGQTAAISFALGMSTTNFTVEDVSVSGGTLTSFTGSGSSYSAVFIPQPNFEGTATITVVAGVFTDDQGRPNLAASIDLAIDTIQPVVSIGRVGSGTVPLGGSELVTFTLSEAATNFTAGDVSVTGGSLSGFTGSGTSYTAAFTPAVGFSGVAQIAVAAGVFTDVAGNPNLAGSPLVMPVDTVAPTVAITRAGIGTLIGGATDALTFTLSVATTDFTAEDVTVIGGSLAGFSGSGGIYTATFVPLMGFQGSASVTVASGAFTSVVGNPNQAAALSIPVDTVPPALTITRTGTGPLTIGATALITFTISEPVTTFNAGVIATSGGMLTGFGGSGTTYTATFVPTPNFEGVAAITVAAGAFTDNVGYPNSAASLSLAVDTVAPTVTLAVSGPALLKVGDTATVTFTLSEPAANFGLQSVSVSGGTLIALQGFGTSFTATLIPAPQFRGTATVAVPGNRFTDLAGNGNLPGNEISLAIDTITPRVVGFRATPGSAVLGIGGAVFIEADFSELVNPGGSFVVRFDSGGAAALVVDGTGLVARGTYVAQPGDFSEDLDVVALVGNGSLQNPAGNPLDETLPPASLGLAANHAIVVDARVKFIGSGGFSTDPTLVRDVRNQFRTIPLRFTIPVTGVSIAALNLSVDGRPVPLRAARILGSGASYQIRLPVSRVNPVGIYTLTVVPGSIRAIANGASATDQVSLYWGFRQSVGMVPDAPAWVVADRIIQNGRRTSVVIQWDRPSGRGGGPVAHYVVHYRVVGTARWLPVRSRIPGWASGTEISGVVPGRLYEFRVAAVNSAGPGVFTSSGAVNLSALAGWQSSAPITGRRA